EVAVHQARASRMALSAQMLSMNRSIYETENMLSALLKEPSRHIERGSLDGQEFSGGAAAGIPLQLVSRRPDIRQAEAELAKAFYATNEARSAFYPSITLSGTLGWTNSAGASVMNPKVWLSNAIAQLMAPLFNRGTNIANLKVAKARQEEALLRFEQSLLDAGNEVNNAVSEWQTANGRIEYDLQQIADLEEAVEKTQFLVRYTTASYLEVLTAQQSLLAAKLVLVQDQVSRIDGVIHLYHALGGGAD
ncbi:MAG: TolC family protein, partial [Bacteroidales bacterium]|nr:TolC family protein [Bacteroidales bacterium]